MLTKEDYQWIYRIYGSKEGFEWHHKENLKHHLEDDVKLNYKIDLALFRDKDISKAKRLAKQVKNPILQKDLLNEILAFSRECIVAYPKFAKIFANQLSLLYF